MLVDNIYQTIRELEPELSVSRFCTDYLDTSRSYLHNKKTTDREVSTDVLLTLYGNLKQSAKTFHLLLDDNSTSQHWVAHFERRASVFESLADSVLSDLTSRTIH